ncbi:MAG: hypothetical protein ABSF15_15580 [Candidatus Sulfotelmatobacter sp.]
MSSHPSMLECRHLIRAIAFACFVSLFVAAHAPRAAAQDFSLSATAFSPQAGVTPGGQASAGITLSTTDSFTGTVTFICSVAPPSGVTSNLPLCLISPSSAVPNATLSLTVTTVGGVSPGQYIVTVTGTSGAETETATLYLNVVNVPQNYTLGVSKAISPTTLTAGGIAQATIAVTAIAGYTGHVTLSCLSITPTVTASPICAFNPSTVTVTNGAPPTSVLTVSTYGILQNQANRYAPRIFFAFWFAVPALALAGAGTSGARRKTLLGLMLLIALAGSLLVLPSCNATSTTSNNNNGLVTPKNTYTFTLTGVDQNGLSPSNTANTTSAQTTVSLTVN